VENLDGFRWVDYDDVWVLERDLLQLVVPIGAVEFVDDDIEGSLLSQGFRGVDSNEIDAALVGVIDKRVLDEALLLLERKSVAYAVP
jgi:hypothetical protein